MFRKKAEPRKEGRRKGKREGGRERGKEGEEELKGNKQMKGTWTKPRVPTISSTFLTSS